MYRTGDASSRPTSTPVTCTLTRLTILCWANWLNVNRLHSSIGRLSPMKMEDLC